jgi:hypothetical protein
MRFGDRSNVSGYFDSPGWFAPPQARLNSMISDLSPIRTLYVPRQPCPTVPGCLGLPGFRRGKAGRFTYLDSRVPTVPGCLGLPGFRRGKAGRFAYLDSRVQLCRAAWVCRALEEVKRDALRTSTAASKCPKEGGSFVVLERRE